MEDLTAYAMESVIAIFGAAITVFTAFLLPKIKNFFVTAKEADNLGIIEAITDWAVEYAEEEFKGEAGQKKFNQAANRAETILGNYGIHVSDDMIKTSIQNGYNKMVAEGQEQKSNKQKVEKYE